MCTTVIIQIKNEHRQQLTVIARLDLKTDLKLQNNPLCKGKTLIEMNTEKIV